MQRAAGLCVVLATTSLLCASAASNPHRSIAGFVPAAAPGIGLRSNQRSAPRASGWRPGAALGPGRPWGRVVGLSMAVDQAKVDTLVKKVQEAGEGSGKASSKLTKVLKKASGAPTFGVEFARKEVEPHKIEGASLAIRRGKAAMILVDTTVDDHGVEDLEQFVAEQATAKGNFPGPAPVVWRGNIKTVEDVARAAAAGCDAVAISMSEAGEAGGELIKAALVLGIEPVAEVQDKDEISTAVEAGAKLIQVRFESTAVESFKAFAAVSLRKEIPDDCVAIATVQGRQGGPEIQYANQMLNAKYHTIVFSNMMSDCTNVNTERYVCYVLSLMLSKKSQSLKVNEAKGSKEVYNAPQGWGDSSTHV